MVNFDEVGNVFPYEIIEMTLPEFEEAFVKNLPDKARRRILFDNYLRFLEDLKVEFPGSFFQWIDGSFTTTKEFPGDIDVVSFIDYDRFIKKPGVINHFSMFGKEEYNVDAHFAVSASWRHRFYKRSQDDLAYWLDVFGSSREDENFNRHPKGIIKIEF